MKNFLKQFSWYSELRYIYRAFFVFGHGFSYLRHRFIIGPRIRRVKHALDRPVETGEYSVHVLCSHNHLTMLLWMLGSWYNVLLPGRAAQVYVHEDGSFTGKDFETVRRLLPSAQVVRATMSRDKAANEWLTGYPAARELRLREDVVFAMKLVDPYFSSTAPVRFLFDADILWFKAPAELFRTVVEEKRSVMMAGRGDMSFSFSDGSLLPKEVRSMNAGIVGYHKSNFNLKTLEEFCQKSRENDNFYFLEQAGHAYILCDSLRALSVQYHIKHPTHVDTVAKHFTGPRREMFWYEGIKRLKDRIL